MTVEAIERTFEQAVALHQRGDLEGAAAGYKNVLTQRPDHVAALTNLAAVLRRAGQSDQALACYRKALDADDSLPALWFNFANLLEARGERDEAERAFRRALALEPSFYQAHFNLARLLQVRAQLDEAAAHYREAVKLAPDFARARERLTAVLRILGERAYTGKRHSEAVAHFQEAVGGTPADADAWNGLAAALHASGEIKPALGAWQRALAIAPDHANAHTNLGSALRLLRRHEEAIGHLRQALQRETGHALARASLAFTLLDVGHASEALEILRPLVKERPEFAEGWLALGNAHTLQANNVEALAAYGKAQALAPDNAAAISNELFSALYGDHLDAGALSALHRELAGRIAAQAGPARVGVRRPGGGRPLRVGYLSPDFRSHPVAFFLEPILAHHDPARAEITCYSLVAAPDATTARLRTLVPRWRDCFRSDDARLAEQIQADGIDLLIDLAGHTSGNRMSVLARHPAPVQALYLGYPCTSGLAAMDWLIGDPRVTPPESAHLYSERIIALDHCFLCYRPPADAPDVAPAPVTANGYITFGCFNNLAKLSPRTLALWARLLRALPEAHLALKAQPLSDPGTREVVWQRFAALDIARERIELLLPTVPLARYLEDYARIDIALDPIPYNGGTTSCETLWQGVPLVTLAGRHFHARMGMSILHTLGLADCVAHTEDDYVEIALGLVRDLPRLTHLRTTLRERIQASPLCDEVGFTRGLEATYERMGREAGSP